MTRRIEKVNELIKRTLGDIILKNFEIPAGGFVTVNKVETDSDLKETKIYLNIFPTEKREKIFALLQKKTLSFQKVLATKLFFHSLPKIKLILNSGLEQFNF